MPLFYVEYEILPEFRCEEILKILYDNQKANISSLVYEFLILFARLKSIFFTTGLI